MSSPVDQIVSRVHVIPVGGDEPNHCAQSSCWCFPIEDTVVPGVIVHHAKDCREAKERQGLTHPDRAWVTIGELVQLKCHSCNH